MVERTDKFLRVLKADFERIDHDLIDQHSFLIEQKYGSVRVLIEWDIDNSAYMLCSFRTTGLPSTYIYVGSEYTMRKRETWNQFSEVIRQLVQPSTKLMADIEEYNRMMNLYFLKYRSDIIVDSCIRNILHCHIPDVSCEDLDTVSDIPYQLRCMMEHQLRLRNRFIEYSNGR